VVYYQTMKEISTSLITKTVSLLVQKSNFELGNDILKLIIKARHEEESPLGRQVLDKIVENAEMAKSAKIPLCQDCGTTVVFLDIGQDVHVIDGDINWAVDEGVRQGYQEGFLRKSMVSHPFSTRINTNDNSPAIIHTNIVPGNNLTISVMPKGGGAENMSRLVMLAPESGAKAIMDAVLNCVREAGGKACPPLIIGLGIGATAEKSMQNAKRSLLREAGTPNVDSEIACLEQEILMSVNRLGIGPLGMGGTTTALAVHADVHPCHIACLPLAINLQCHSARHATAVL